MEVRSIAAPVRKNRYNASTGLVDYLFLAGDSPINTVRRRPAEFVFDGHLSALCASHSIFYDARRSIRMKTNGADGWVTRTQHSS